MRAVTTRSPRRDALVAILRRRPRDTSSLAASLGWTVAEVSEVLNRSLTHFVRANPGVQCSRRVRAVWRLRKKGDPPPAPVRRICRHCCRRAVTRPKGLCWTCYYAPGVKEEYASGSKFGRRSPAGTGNSPGSVPPAPTTAAPGTSEKILVMERRVAAKQTPHHPADARYEGDPRPLEWLASGALSNCQRVPA